MLKFMIIMIFIYDWFLRKFKNGLESLYQTIASGIKWRISTEVWTNRRADHIRWPPPPSQGGHTASAVEREGEHTLNIMIVTAYDSIAWLKTYIII